MKLPSRKLRFSCILIPKTTEGEPGHLWHPVVLYFIINCFTGQTEILLKTSVNASLPVWEEALNPPRVLPMVRARTQFYRAACAAGHGALYYPRLKSDGDDIYILVKWKCGRTDAQKWILGGSLQWSMLLISARTHARRLAASLETILSIIAKTEDKDEPL